MKIMKGIAFMGLLSGLLAALGCSNKEDAAPRDQREESSAAAITVEQEIQVGKPVVLGGP